VIPRLIDELVVLGALAARYPGKTTVEDAKELRVKESDRVVETVRILRAFGVDADEEPEGFVVRGGNPLQGADLDVSSDHRVAMTAAVLACAADGESILRGFDVAGVSYPDFVDVLRSIGASVEELA
jgi:3-phosphoshikimate 1-carboxyvinyltransferase